MRGRLARNPAAPEDPAHVAALEQHQVERHFRDLAGREADHEETPLPAERTQRRLGVRTADRIVDHIDAALAAEPAQAVAQVLGRVVHDRVGAVLAREAELVVAGGAGDHARAHDLA